MNVPEELVPAGWTPTRWLERLHHLTAICVVPDRREYLEDWATALARKIAAGERPKAGVVPAETPAPPAKPQRPKLTQSGSGLFG